MGPPCPLGGLARSPPGPSRWKVTEPWVGSQRKRGWGRQGLAVGGLTLGLCSGPPSRPGSPCTPSGRGAVGSPRQRGREGALSLSTGLLERGLYTSRVGVTLGSNVVLGKRQLFLLSQKTWCFGPPFQCSETEHPQYPYVHPKSPYQAGQDVSSDEHVEDVVPACGGDEPCQQGPQGRTCMKHN